MTKIPNDILFLAINDNDYKIADRLSHILLGEAKQIPISRSQGGDICFPSIRDIQISKKKIVLVHSIAAKDGSSSNDKLIEILLLTKYLREHRMLNMQPIILIPGQSYSDIRFESIDLIDTYELHNTLIEEMIKSTNALAIVGLDRFYMDRFDLRPEYFWQECLNKIEETKPEDVDLCLVCLSRYLEPKLGWFKDKLREKNAGYFITLYKESGSDISIEKGNDSLILDQHCVIIDSGINTGSMIFDSAKFLAEHGARNIDVIATHGFFYEDAIEKFSKFKSIDNVYVSDSLPQDKKWPGLHVISCANDFEIALYNIFNASGYINAMNR